MSSHKDFENRSKNAAFQKMLEFYYTFLLRHRQNVGVKYCVDPDQTVWVYTVYPDLSVLET